MDKYIITIKKGNRSYAYGRYYKYDSEIAIVLDTLEALFHLKLIDEFTIKEANTSGTKSDKAANVH